LLVANKNILDWEPRPGKMGNGASARRKDYALIMVCTLDCDSMGRVRNLAYTVQGRRRTG